MANIEGRLIRLRAVESDDAEVMYQWENDIAIWSVSGTTEPFSRDQIAIFTSSQLDKDIFRTGQLRLMIETLDHRAVGAVDLFEFDPMNHRAGVGILIHDPDDRGHGYGADTLRTLEEYGRRYLGLHQLWCNVGANNSHSLNLFRSAGYTEVGRKRDWQWTCEGYCDEVMLQKILD